MEPLRWLFELRDRISGPARKISRSLREARGGLDEVNEGIRPVETGFSGFLSKSLRMITTIGKLVLAFGALARVAMFLGGMGFFKELPKIFAALRSGGIRGFLSEGGAALGRMGETFLDRIGLARSSAGQLGNRLASAWDTMKPAVGRAFKIGAGLAVAGLAAWGIFSALRSVFSISIQIGDAIATWTRRFVEAVAQARIFRERATFGLTLLTGSRGGAQEVLDEARRLSDFLGTDLHETIAGIQELMVRGFSRRESSSLFQAMADLRAISPRPVDTSRILLAIGQIRQAGRLQGDELNQLAESGLPLDAIRRRMAANLGTNVENLRSLQSAGRISSDVALRSIMEGISDVTGSNVGAAGREFSFTLPGLIERLQAFPTRLFDEIASKSDGAFGRLRDILLEVNELLDPRSSGMQSFLTGLATGFDVIMDAGSSAWAVLRELFLGVVEGFGTGSDITGQGALASLRDFLAWLRGPEVLRSIRMVGQGIGIAFDWLTSPAGLGMILGMLVPFAAVLTSIALLASPIVIGISAVIAVFAALGAVIGWLIDAVPRLHEWIVGTMVESITWGQDIVNGLIEGLRSGLEMLRGVGRELGGAVRGGLDSVMAFGSPSRTMMELGRMTGAGFAIGLSDSMPDVGAVATPQLGAAAARAGRGGPVSLNLELNVQGGNGDPESIVEAVRRALIPELESALTQLTIEQGVG